MHNSCESSGRLCKRKSLKLMLSTCSAKEGHALWDCKRMKNIIAKVKRRMHQAAQTTHESGCCSMCGTEQTGSQVGKPEQSIAGAQGYAVHPWRLGKKASFHHYKHTCTNTHPHAHTHSFICQTWSMKQNKRYCWLMFQYNFPFFLFWFSFSCVFPYLPPDYFYICCSLTDSPPFLPPSFFFASLSISLITLVLYFRVGLLQS